MLINPKTVRTATRHSPPVKIEQRMEVDKDEITLTSFGMMNDFMWYESIFETNLVHKSGYHVLCRFSAHF